MRSLSPRLFAGAAVCLALSSTPTAAHAFVCLSPLGGVQTDPIRCVRWTGGYTNVKALLGSAGTQLFNGTWTWDENIQSAAQEWNSTASGIFIQVSGGTLIDPCGPRGPGHACVNTGPVGDNPIFFAETACGTAFGDIIALTTNCFDPSPVQPRMVNAPIFFNRSVAWNAYDGALRPDRILDIRRVILHELGHVVGLLHPDDHGQSVRAIMNRAVSSTDRLQLDDINGVRFMYADGAPPAGGPPAGAKSGCHIAPTTTGPGPMWWLVLLGVAFAAIRRRSGSARSEGQT